MAFKKTTDSETGGMYIIGSRDKNRYPPGFEYRIGRTTYTVLEDVTKDTGSEMRRVVTSDGSIEIMTPESIDLDLREPDVQILNDGQPKKEKVKEEVKEKVKEETPVEEKGEKDELEGLDW